jgi:hypothetical protein
MLEHQEKDQQGAPSSSGSRGAPSASTEGWESTSSRTAMTGPLPGTMPARAPASCRHCRRPRGYLSEHALAALRRPHVRVLATLAGARWPARAHVTAPARSSRHRRWILAATGALGPNAGPASADVRLTGHEKLLFRVDVMSTTKGSLASRPAGGIGRSSYCR